MLKFDGIWGHRRSISAGLRAAAALVALAVAVIAGPALAQGTEQPNQFTLTGSGIRVDYSSTSITGQPRLRYRADGLDLQFAGDDITVDATDLGTVVSVVIANSPDRGAVIFSVVLPDFNLDSQNSSRFRTIGVSTTLFTTIGGPALVRGPLSEYSSRALNGVAQLVRS